MKHRLDRRPKPPSETNASQLAKRLHDELGQHLVGVTLATGALERKLGERQAPELGDVRQIVQHLREANLEVSRLISWLDRGLPR